MRDSRLLRAATRMPLPEVLHSMSMSSLAAALPADGRSEIPIEQRGSDEVATVTGRAADGTIATVRIVPDGAAVANYGFDVTPARLVTGLITERGVLAAERAALARAFAERAAAAE